MPALLYPVTARTNQVDNYHGTLVADPYRWLEDDNAEATKAWVEAENKVTFDFLGKIPQRAAIKQRLTQLWNYERFGVPMKQGGRYFITRNNGLQNQAVLYTMTSLEAAPVLLLDPNTLSTDGTVSLAGYSISDDGNLMAYGLARAGSDWEEWHVRDVRTGQDLKDEIHWVKFSGASWRKDGEGFYYSRYDEPAAGNALKGVNYFHKLYYHRLGTPQADDHLIYQRPDHKDWNFNGGVTDDGHYLIIDASEGTDTRNRVFYLDLQKPGSEVVELLNEFDAAYHFVDNVGTVFYFNTDLNAPRGRIIAIDIAQPERVNWRELVPQSPDRLEGVSLVDDQFIATYLKDARSEVKIFKRDGAFIRTVDLPGLGTVGGFGGKRGDTETFYAFTSFTTPTSIYRYDLTEEKSSIFKQPHVAFSPDDYETKQIFYHSKDGTRVPMFITYKKGLKLDGKNPTYLYGYGGFDISITPSFSPATLDWMEMGGVFAVANIRGGGEYGEEWHHGGMKLKKQNVFDDFIAAAEWLIANHYTETPKLAIGGGSNGGLLVGACLTQRPDLYGAALPSVGVMDMLRFHKFTIGWAWTSDYGSSDDPEYFKTLYAYSPLHHIKPGTKYPATLITTGDHDDRVVPAHSFKFAATLQAAQSGPKPILIRIETRAGHGAGKPTSKVIEESADKWAFLVEELHMHPENLAK
ncbi:MAG TPA: prolyl oligopeptidase family serine peptidase [Verrucomicrobiae bacterium]|jgi:prolyl oligopeptidase|nr:prolyl oligopeptidase family serine peptidase [Verrucomicrobiae bacterium]